MTAAVIPAKANAAMRDNVVVLLFSTYRFHLSSCRTYTVACLSQHMIIVRSMGIVAFGACCRDACVRVLRVYVFRVMAVHAKFPCR